MACLSSPPDLVTCVKFENMRALTRLDLSNSSGDNKLFSNLLNQCVSLKSLNISYCLRITDDMFTMASINSRLEELNLSYIKQVIWLAFKEHHKITKKIYLNETKNKTDFRFDHWDTFSSEKYTENTQAQGLLECVQWR